MMVVECECGSEILFVSEDGTTSPMTEECECGNVYQLKVAKVRRVNDESD